MLPWQAEGISNTLFFLLYRIIKAGGSESSPVRRAYLKALRRAASNSAGLFFRASRIRGAHIQLLMGEEGARDFAGSASERDIST